MFLSFWFTSSADIWTYNKCKDMIIRLQIIARAKEIVQSYNLAQPLHRQYYKPKKDKYKVVAKITLKRGTSPVKFYSKFCKDIYKATQDAAKQVVTALQQKENFVVDYLNLDTRMQQRKKRCILEIKLASEEISYNALKQSYFEICSENVKLKQLVHTQQNGDLEKL